MNNLNRGKRYLLAILSGLLMLISFPFSGSLTPLVFIAWVPLLIIENYLSQNKMKTAQVFLPAYLTFIVFNIGTTWWIWNADIGGAIMAFIFNSLLMALFFLLFVLIKKSLPQKIGIWSLIPVWISFEYLHYNWELSHPWLTMGNFFSTTPTFIQWYEFTGTLGGSLWVLVVNILIFFLIKTWCLKQKRKQTALILAISLTLPIATSFFIYFIQGDDTAARKKYELVVVQPNIDPYKEKFNLAFGPEKQMVKFIELAKQKITPKTQLIVGPETAIQGSFNETEPNENNALRLLRATLLKPNSSFDLLIGASTYRLFTKKNSAVAQAIPNTKLFYESYNTSLFLQHKKKPKYIHKSKLVLGVEKIPFSNFFPFLEKLAIQNGGTSGSLGIEKSAKIFNVRQVKIAPSVCYESIYGDFLCQQTRLGAELFIVITNDGWWGDTPGYRQHFSFAQMRAIENRRYVVQSANTGTSGVINTKGEILNATPYSKSAVINVSVPLHNEVTFYAKHGDYIGRFSLILLGIIIALGIFKRFTDKNIKLPS